MQGRWAGLGRAGGTSAGRARGAGVWGAQAGRRRAGGAGQAAAARAWQGRGRRAAGAQQARGLGAGRAAWALGLARDVHSACFRPGLTRYCS